MVEQLPKTKKPSQDVSTYGFCQGRKYDQGSMLFCQRSKLGAKLLEDATALLFNYIQVSGTRGAFTGWMHRKLWSDKYTWTCTLKTDINDSATGDHYIKVVFCWHISRILTNLYNFAPFSEILIWAKSLTI